MTTIPANAREVKLLHDAAQAATRAKRDLDLIFEAFCAAHDLAPGMALLGLTDDGVLVQSAEERG